MALLPILTAPDPRLTLSPKRYHRGTVGGWREDFSAWDRFEFDRTKIVLQRLQFRLNPRIFEAVEVPEVVVSIDTHGV